MSLKSRPGRTGSTQQEKKQVPFREKEGKSMKRMGGVNEYNLKL
jgi:hypothetical protein